MVGDWRVGWWWCLCVCGRCKTPCMLGFLEYHGVSNLRCACYVLRNGMPRSQRPFDCLIRYLEANALLA